MAESPRDMFVDRMDRIMRREGFTFDVDRDPGSITLLPRIRVTLFGWQVVIPNTPLCTMEQLTKLIELIDWTAKAEAEKFPLPEGHAWNHKGLHGLHAASDALEIYRELFKPMPEENIFLLMLLAAAHDLGRARQVATGAPGQLHGQLSFEALVDAGLHTVGLSDDLLKLMAYVLTHHADKDTPVMAKEAAPLEWMTIFYTAVIRDVDKVANFRHKTWAYLFDKNEKARQSEILRQLNPKFKGETGLIDDPRYLDEFLEGRTLDRRDLLSYEAYMLQFLAWIYDLNLRESLAEIVRCGAVHVLLAYFQTRLRATQSSLIRERTANFVRKAGVPFLN